MWKQNICRTNRKINGTGEEETNAENHADAGISGDSADIPDGTDGDGTVVQSGDAEAVAGADQETEDRENGNSVSGEIGENAIKTECGADFDMTDEEWKDLWEKMNCAIDELDWLDRDYDATALVKCRIPKETLEEYYHHAIDVAAGLEKILNGKKYSA